ncbi:MAG: branched-chain amino acid aminotransferase [Alphaproteobacteria bacterium]|jgi:branched-chain amino acid aminotransferase|nr:branched-chain amino acid aminotransferase [Alphaproteobacteria bacterium]MDP6236957.1 branched-chain amino acid aminotransferase [Alphaproteobacteria bacterium]MDP7172083.1 branched-chain amino acid aminotransferase [Alphaproteobacteria bacterium]MDP7233471.1 branched-chain amino acid aminotransferase [Alphaproteobacteria bacterium]MDP7487900.1 branched-chain amino acid aminotransferase [Alphaproteobacteria bacterium]|tara:strand:+ start:2324 stop:3223 length:900 start_codon:yes stop_codon:yes gene_type:complete
MLSFDDHDGFIWYDGKMVPWREANLHVLSHGLHYASSVFEGQRVYAGTIFKLAEHTERLFESASQLGFEIPFSQGHINRANYDVCKANNIDDGYVRPVAWRGSEMMGVSAQQNAIHVAIAAWEWPSYFSPEARLKGIKLQWSDWRRPDPATIPAKAKAAGLYMICTLSKHKAEAEGFDDALMLDWRGRLAESTGANIFLVINGELHTPTPDCFLDGITRRTVIGLAEAQQIPVIERIIMPEELEKADEVFLTGTAAEVTPVGQIGDLSFTPGEVCRILIDDFTALTNGLEPDPAHIGSD